MLKWKTLVGLVFWWGSHLRISEHGTHISALPLDSHLSHTLSHLSTPCVFHTTASKSTRQALDPVRAPNGRKCPASKQTPLLKTACACFIHLVKFKCKHEDHSSEGTPHIDSQTQKSVFLEKVLKVKSHCPGEADVCQQRTPSSLYPAFPRSREDACSFWGESPGLRFIPLPSCDLPWLPSIVQRNGSERREVVYMCFLS